MALYKIDYYYYYYYYYKFCTDDMVLFQPDVEVFRRSSPSQPSLDDCEVDWEETVYLNLILQHVSNITSVVSFLSLCTKGDGPGLSFAFYPRVGSGVVRIDPHCFLAKCRKRQLKQVLSYNLAYVISVCCC